MTNEELAIKIQQGDNSYTAVLWDKVSKLMYKILYKFSACKEYPAYISREDLEQELYFALLTAVKSYNPNKGYKFTSYLSYCIKNMLNRKVVSTNQLNITENSYNVTVGEDEETELIELLEDTASNDFVYDIELIEMQRQVQNAVERLPHLERQAITLYWLKDKTYKECGKLMGISPERVRQITNSGLRYLRTDKQLKLCYYGSNEIIRYTTARKQNKNIDIELELTWQRSKEYQQTFYNILSLKSQGNYNDLIKAYDAFKTAEERFKNNYRKEKEINMFIKYEMGLNLKQPHYG